MTTIYIRNFHQLISIYRPQEERTAWLIRCAVRIWTRYNRRARPRLLYHCRPSSDVSRLYLINRLVKNSWHYIDPASCFVVQTNNERQNWISSKTLPKTIVQIAHDATRVILSTYKTYINKFLAWNVKPAIAVSICLFVCLSVKACSPRSVLVGGFVRDPGFANFLAWRTSPLTSITSSLYGDCGLAVSVSLSVCHKDNDGVTKRGRDGWWLMIGTWWSTSLTPPRDNSNCRTMSARWCKMSICFSTIALAVRPRETMTIEKTSSTAVDERPVSRMTVTVTADVWRRGGADNWSVGHGSRT